MRGILTKRRLFLHRRGRAHVPRGQGRRIPRGVFKVQAGDGAQGGRPGELRLRAVAPAAEPGVHRRRGPPRRPDPGAVRREEVDAGYAGVRGAEDAERVAVGLRQHQRAVHRVHPPRAAHVPGAHARAKGKGGEFHVEAQGSGADEDSPGAHSE